MSKLKSLKEFKQDGLSLSREHQANIQGGVESNPLGLDDISDTYFFRATNATAGVKDCERCANKDEGYYYNPNTTIFKCINTAVTSCN